MTRTRANAYSNLMWMLRTSALGSLDKAETELVRNAADTLVFAATLHVPTARLALLDVEKLADELVEDERWPEAAASLLVECVADCGPRTPAAAQPTAGLAA